MSFPEKPSICPVLSLKDYLVRTALLFFHVFNTGLLSLFLRQYCLDPLILKSCLYMFHTVRPNAYRFSKQETLLFVSGFLREVTQKFHFPQSSLKLYGGHIEKIVQYFLRLYFRWTVVLQSTLHWDP